MQTLKRVIRLIDFRRFGTLGKSMISLAVMVLITGASVASVMAATKVAHIVCDGVEKDVQITSEQTDLILLDAGIQTSPGDLVQRDSDPDHPGDIRVTVKTAYPVTIQQATTTLETTAHYGDTVGQTLAAAGVEIYGNDRITPSANTAIKGATAISLQRCYQVAIAVDNVTHYVTVTEGTVGEALVQAGISVGPDDMVSPASTNAVTDGMQIAVSRVTYRNVTQTKAVAFKTVTKQDPTLTAGSTKVASKGSNGSQQTVYYQKLVDGAVAESKAVSTSVTAQPVNQVTVVGTRQEAAPPNPGGTVSDGSGKPVSFKKVITGRCSAYTGGGWTSTGRKAAFGLVAVNPNLIPYGTRLYIASPDGRFVYGYAIAADTGGAAMQGAIVADLYYDTYSQCMNLGTRTMNVYIL